MLTEGKQYILLIDTDREEESVLRVNEVVFSSKRNGVEHFELDTREFAKNIVISEDEILDYEEVLNGQFYNQNLNFEQLVHEMIMLIKRIENRRGEEHHLNLFTSMETSLINNYGVSDREDRREIYYEAYNRTHDRQIPYEPKN